MRGRADRRQYLAAEFACQTRPSSRSTFFGNSNKLLLLPLLADEKSARGLNTLTASERALKLSASYANRSRGHSAAEPGSSAFRFALHQRDREAALRENESRTVAVKLKLCGSVETGWRETVTRARRSLFLPRLRRIVQLRCSHSLSQRELS